MNQGKEFTKAGGMSFDNWWKTLQWIAEVDELSWLLADQEDHRDGWNNDDTPEEELSEQLDAAAQNM